MQHPPTDHAQAQPNAPAAIDLIGGGTAAQAIDSGESYPTRAVRTAVLDQLLRRLTLDEIAAYVGAPPVAITRWRETGEGLSLHVSGRLLDLIYGPDVTDDGLRISPASDYAFVAGNAVAHALAAMQPQDRSADIPNLTNALADLLRLAAGAYHSDGPRAVADLHRQLIDPNPDYQPNSTIRPAARLRVVAGTDATDRAVGMPGTGQPGPDTAAE